MASTRTSDPEIPGALGTRASSDDLGTGDRLDPLLLIGLVVGLIGAGVVSLLLVGGLRRRPAVEADLAAVPAPLAPVGWMPATVATPIEEENVPRWLRASVREERFWTPAQPTPRTIARRTLAFDEPTQTSATRLHVRYDHVEVLDQPNEVFARTLTEVGTGDEVEVIEQADAWALVRTPRGTIGWLPTMTVGPPAPRDSGAVPGSPDPPDVPAKAPAKSPSPRRARRPRQTS